LGLMMLAAVGTRAAVEADVPGLKSLPVS